MREDILNDLRAEYERQREQDDRDHTERVSAAMREIPELGSLLAQRQQLIQNALRGILKGNTTAADIPAEMEKLNSRIGDSLEKHGMSRDSLEPVYRCPVCEDRGYTGEPVRSMCDCMKKRYQEKLRQAIGLENSGRETVTNSRAEGAEHQ